MEKHISVEHLNLFLTQTNLSEGVIQVTKYVRPEWPETQIKIKVFTDGFSNRLVGVYLDHNSNDMILVRVFGEKTELFINRKLEVRNMGTMYKSGLIPPVHCTFENGICYGYSVGTVLDHNMVCDPIISRLIIEMLVRMHTIRPQLNRSDTNECTQEPKPCLFRDLRKLLELIPCELTDKQQNKRFKKFVPKKENLISEVNNLEFVLKESSSPVVFCHNDLLLKNIIYNSDKISVTFIDFEYSDYNYQAFDIGNHFCEFAGVDTYNPSLYPNRDFQINWLRNYLEAGYALKGHSILSDSPEKSSIDKDVEILYKQVNQFSLAAHLYWGLWAIFQTEHSTINFDYLGYAIQRIRQYCTNKVLLNESQSTN